MASVSFWRRSTGFRWLLVVYLRLVSMPNGSAPTDGGPSASGSSWGVGGCCCSSCLDRVLSGAFAGVGVYHCVAGGSEQLGGLSAGSGTVAVDGIRVGCAVAIGEGL